MKNHITYYILLLSIAIYSTVGIFTRLASDYDFLSWCYLLLVGAAVCVLAIYAVLWQQIIRRVNLSVAYMFKGLGVVFTLLICHFLFGEHITVNNIAGGAIIIAGITLFAWADHRGRA